MAGSARHPHVLRVRSGGCALVAPNWLRRLRLRQWVKIFLLRGVNSWGKFNHQTVSLMQEKK
ncbi:hypothetical protein BN4901_4352 [Citrobacter europaeus]|uniref:DNA metabolism protein n=1 Tax=Citrobacter europaeus TaxID=1914243 RepID=A0ABY0JV22_9ENTR|nr:hypothetical protein BN4901_4352 [Citrobacter europaeus]